MRKFRYISKEIDPEDGNLKSYTVTITEDEILRNFYQQWLDLNVVSLRPEVTSKAQCVEDWVAIHNAVEIKEGE